MPAYKNHFRGAVFHDHEIAGEDGRKIGELRVKPSGLLWKNKDKGKYYRVPLDKFIEWITAPATGATRPGQ